MRRLAGTVALLLAGRAHAQPAPADTAPRVSVGGFLDAYYAWDVRQPANFDRAYTTQPARHAEFNVNLAFLETRLTGPRYRGRLALQWGTSVQANYAGEPRHGAVSGPSVSQFLQEASVGYQLAPTLWVDGGIFLAHLGYEGWVSRDNPTYTRSLVADYSPYYEAGAKLTWTPSPSVTATVALINGWQVISSDNTPPAGGVRIDWAATPRLTLTYDDFVGDMAPDSAAAARVRLFHEVIAQYRPTPRWLLAGTLDVGTQGRSAATGGTATWWGTSVIGRFQATGRVAVAGRVERYADPDQVVVATGLGVPFRTTGASLGLDVALTPKVLWRTEARGFASSDAVWPTHGRGGRSRSDGVLVTSLALTL